MIMKRVDLKYHTANVDDHKETQKVHFVCLLTRYPTLPHGRWHVKAAVMPTSPLVRLDVVLRCHGLLTASTRRICMPRSPTWNGAMGQERRVVDGAAGLEGEVLQQQVDVWGHDLEAGDKHAADSLDELLRHKGGAGVTERVRLAYVPAGHCKSAMRVFVATRLATSWSLATACSVVVAYARRTSRSSRTDVR